VTKLEGSLGYVFVERELLARALTHRSFTEETAGEDRHNERLEWLGDAVLEMLTTEALHQRFEQAPEGQLSRMRAELVRTQTLAAVGRDFDVGPHLRLGRGEELTGGREKDRVLANAVEALLGAAWVDGGLAAVTQPYERGWRGRIEAIEDPATYGKDPKSALQELSWKLWQLHPRYVDLGHEGPPHARTYHCGVQCGEHVTARGSGASKRSAQRAAARIALGRARQPA